MCSSTRLSALVFIQNKKGARLLPLEVCRLPASQLLFDILSERAVVFDRFLDLLMGSFGEAAVEVFHFAGIVGIHADVVLLSGVLFIIWHKG